MDADMKLPVTAIVVTYNEAARLEDCLRSLRFCNEIIVCDLFSKDISATIGRKFADRFVQRARVDYVELLWPELAGMATNDWILRFDPDQVVPEPLQPEIELALEKGIRESASCINLPLLYYFLGKPIYYSVWGNVRKFPLLFDRREVTFPKVVHEGLKFNPRLPQISVDSESRIAIEHYWVDNISQMISKHYRYLRNEGQGRNSRGEKFRWKSLISDCRDSLRENFTNSGCLNHGWKGFYLGGFHFMYVAGSHLSLFIFELRRGK